MNVLRCLIFSILLVLTGCARPNYQDPNADGTAGAQGLCTFEFSQSLFCADLIWEKQPTQTEAGSFVLEFHSRDDRSQFVELTTTLEVVLWMPSMGHGSSPVRVEKLGMGQYRVTNVYFIMRGDWEIQLKLKSGNNVVEQATHPIHF